jgi:hypothetical protein
MNKYYFSLSIQFKKDINLNVLQDALQIKATKLTPLAESKGTEKTAKFSYRTESLTNIYTDEEFARFVSEIESRLADIKPLLAEFDGFCNFCIVFEELEESPCISLSEETIAKLGRLGASFDVDFI